MKKNRICLMVTLIFCINLFMGCSNGQSDDTYTEEEEETYLIPGVQGLSEQEAKKKLDEAGITYTIKYGDFCEEHEKDVICEQSFIGESETNSVELKKSMGLIYNIGELSGQSYGDAKQTLRPFRKVFSYSYSPTYKRGVIINSGFSNRKFHKGDTGAVLLSIGKFNEKKVKGQDVSIAKRQFPKAKFSIKYKLSSAKRGRVLSYSVGKSDKKKNIPVELVLSNGLAAKMPDVRGLSYRKAINKLKKKGIRCKINYIYDGEVTSRPNVSDGLVLSQSKKGTINKKNPVTLNVRRSALLISQISIEKDYPFYEVTSNISLENASDKSIASVRIGLTYYNQVGEKIDSIQDKYVGPLLSAVESDENEDLWVCNPGIFDSTTAAVKPTSAYISFMDGSSQQVTFSGVFWHTSEYVRDGYLEP